MYPGFDSQTRHHMWVEFVVGSLLFCPERFFLGYSGFPLSSKTNISKFQFDPRMHGHFWMSSCELLGAPCVNKLHMCIYKLQITFTGLRMEYCLLLAKVTFSREASLFEGSTDRFVPIYNTSAIQSDIFGLAGKMMSYMIVHHDVSFSCMSPAVYEYLVTGDLDKAAWLSSVLDVPDWDIREIISKVTMYPNYNWRITLIGMIIHLLYCLSLLQVGVIRSVVKRVKGVP